MVVFLLFCFVFVLDSWVRRVVAPGVGGRGQCPPRVPGPGPAARVLVGGARWGDRGVRKRRAQPRVHRWKCVRYSIMTRGNRELSRWVPVGTEGLRRSSSGNPLFSVLKVLYCLWIS